MKKSFFMALAVATGVLIAASIYVSASVVPALGDVRRTFAGDRSRITEADLARAQASLERARATLNNVPAQLLRLLPVARQNVSAVQEITQHGIAVIRPAREIWNLLDEEPVPSLGDGVDIDRLRELGILTAQAETALKDLRRAAEDHLSGWLVPPVWDGLNELSDKAQPAVDTATRASRLLAHAPDLLGATEPRTYLVLLLNNAELRGAGGILSSAGTVTFKDGEIKIGRFRYYVDLAAARGTVRVRAPSDLRRRFGRYDADTTQWINATASPDLPEVAVVTRRLFKEATGKLVDGVIAIDPRGLAALLDPDEEIAVPRTRLSITGDGLARFVYRDAYERFEENDRRRKILLELGPVVLRKGLQDFGRAKLERLARASAGGHLRIISFSRDESDALADAGVTGDLADHAANGVFVSMQNLGADKLDPWIDRAINIRCDVSSPTKAHCRLEVKLENRSPMGLPLYVVQEKSSYALYKGYLEVYVPADAEVTEYSLDGVPARAFIEHEDDRSSLGTYVDIKRGSAVTAVAAYTIDIDSFRIAVMPQPLSHDAWLEVVIDVPQTWAVTGPVRVTTDVVRYEGALAGPVIFSAQRSVDETSGLTRAWRTVTGLWREG